MCGVQNCTKSYNIFKSFRHHILSCGKKNSSLLENGSNLREEITHQIVTEQINREKPNETNQVNINVVEDNQNPNSVTQNESPKQNRNLEKKEYNFSQSCMLTQILLVKECQKSQVWFLESLMILQLA